MPSDAPFLSVIIPVYNSEAFLPQCLDSVISQTYQNIEIIVVDDGSLGNCKEICSLYPELFTQVMGKKIEDCFMRREHGIKLAKGQYTLHLDADDNLPTNTIPRITEVVVGDILLSETESI